MLLHFLCFSLIQYAGAFVYSCDEVNRLMNTTFDEYSQFACVVAQQNFSNHAQLATIYISLNEISYSFSDIANQPDSCVENIDRLPWRISGEYPELDCEEQFTLILKSDEYSIVHPLIQPSKFSTGSAVFVVPETGMYFNRKSASGTGNVTLYDGAGTGEDEERYLLQTWECERMPDWIYLLESVITIEADSTCALLLLSSSDLSFDGRVDMYRHDRLVLLNSGRSDNLQNRANMSKYAYVRIGHCEQSNVAVSMDLTFDTENIGENRNGTIGLMKSVGGPLSYFRNGTYADNFHTDYFEIRWFPEELSGDEVSSNQDNIYIDITVSPFNDEYLCPEGYELVSSVDDQHWCYTMNWPVPPVAGYTWAEANEVCNSTGDTLPIVTSFDINDSLLDFASLHFGFTFSDDNVWLGIICDSGLLCSNLNPLLFALHNDSTWGWLPKDHTISYTVCARRAEVNPTFVSTTTITTMAPNLGNPLPTWAIVTIIVCVILFCAAVLGIILLVRRQSRLRAEIVEVQIDKAKQIHGPVAHSRYYDMGNEWEIERKFVSIERSRLLGQGAFGSVYLGRVLAKNIPLGAGRSIAELATLTTNNDKVAVKMLHETADSQRELEFRAEILLMKRIGYHEQLVNMLACVTLSEPVLLICEYCANGDLLNFMRQRRNYMLTHPDEIKAPEVITAKKQLMFAIQISYGLEYLSSRGFIHRDIAARNIMVDKEESCKIGDFGLARSVEEDHENYLSQGGKLPLKWMSPEAIDKFTFSTASDVWSYGVLLFEIVTLGGTPYAGWPAAELLTRLKRGERMERPDNCNDNMYELICACWQLQPRDRPKFGELRKRLARLLEEINPDGYYLKLNAHAEYYVLESNASE